MSVSIEKIPGVYSVDGLEQKNGKCGCTSVKPCCSTCSKMKWSGNTFSFIARLTDLESNDTFAWIYSVKKLIIKWKSRLKTRGTK
jgi:hypothetical protein